MSKQRQAVRVMARKMEERFAEFDGKKGIGPNDSLRGFAEALMSNAERLLDLTRAAGGDLGMICQHAVDVANYAAIISALAHYQGSEPIEGEQCESGCADPAVTYAGDDVPVCALCALGLITEPDAS